MDPIEKSYKSLWYKAIELNQSCKKSQRKLNIIDQEEKIEVNKTVQSQTIKPFIVEGEKLDTNNFN